MGDALALFPEEIWGIILNNLEDSTDVWNIFRAFPQLDNSAILHKKKPLWLFGLIVPILTPWKKTRSITTEMLLNCRLTCKHWSTAVDTFLENQPQLRAFNHENQGSERFPWNPKAYMEDRDIDKYNPESKASNHIGGVKFDNGDESNPVTKLLLSKFLQAMDQHPPNRNPFLSRSLSFAVSDSSANEEEEFWNDAISLHQKFGKHVWFYKLQFTHLDDLDPRYFAECLSKLPNLKALHLIGSESSFEAFSEFHGNGEECPPALRTFIERVDIALPAFPHLETLKIVGDFEYLSLFLIRRFSAGSQIRRLEIQVDLWRPEYSQLFPNLTELDLVECEPDDVKNLMLSLEAPQLAKLQLNFYCWVRKPQTCQFGIEEDIFPWLKRFPMLKSFMLAEGCKVVQIEEEGTLSPETDSIKSLQFLAIRTSFGMSYNFLRCLPSLQHLNLFVPLEPVVIDHSTNPVVRIREELQTGKMYDSNVWELLPKLKTVNLLVEEDDEDYIRASYEFHREHYEQTKRVAAVSPRTSEVNFSRLRQDIIDCMGIGKIRTSTNNDSDGSIVSSVSSEYDSADDESYPIIV